MWQLRTFNLKNEAETIDVSVGSRERALNELLKENKILKITGGRHTKYIYINKLQ